MAITLASPPTSTGHTACSPGHPWPATATTSTAPDEAGGLAADDHGPEAGATSGEAPEEVAGAPAG